MRAIQVNTLGLGEYFKVEPTDLCSVHGVFAEWGCNTSLTADQLETKLAVPPLLPQHSTAHTRPRTHAHSQNHAGCGTARAAVCADPTVGAVGHFERPLCCRSLAHRPQDGSDRHDRSAASRRRPRPDARAGRDVPQAGSADDSIPKGFRHRLRAPIDRSAARLSCASVQATPPFECAPSTTRLWSTTLRPLVTPQARTSSSKTQRSHGCALPHALLSTSAGRRPRRRSSSCMTSMGSTPARRERAPSSCCESTASCKRIVSKATTDDGTLLIPRTAANWITGSTIRNRAE